MRTKEAAKILRHTVSDKLMAIACKMGCETYEKAFGFNKRAGLWQPDMLDVKKLPKAKLKPAHTVLNRKISRNLMKAEMGSNDSKAVAQVNGSHLRAHRVYQDARKQGSTAATRSIGVRVARHIREANVCR